MHPLGGQRSGECRKRGGRYMSAGAYGSWGRLGTPAQDVRAIYHRDDALPKVPDERTWLPYGNGRSYGDSCLNDGGFLLVTRGLDRFIAFDETTGELECEAGVLLAEILRARSCRAAGSCRSRRARSS